MHFVSMHAIPMHLMVMQFFRSCHFHAVHVPPLVDVGFPVLVGLLQIRLRVEDGRDDQRVAVVSRAVVVGQRQQLRMPAVQTIAVGVTLDDHRLGVVEKHLLRDTAKMHEGGLESRDPAGGILAIAEAHGAAARIAQRSDEGEQPMAAPPDRGEVHLHLLAGGGFEAHQRLRRRLLERRKEHLELTDAPVVALLSNLAQQHRRGNPVRPCRLDPRDQIRLVGGQLLRPRRTSSVACCFWIPQVAPHRVARTANLPRDCSNTRALQV